MRSFSKSILILVLTYILFGALSASATLLPNPDGQTVYDTLLQVNWLADANFAASADGQAIVNSSGISGVNLRGSMTYNAALQFRDAMNGAYGLNGGAGYLFHNNWTLPATPATDPNCTVRNWAYNCSGSALGSLYYLSLPTGGPALNFGFTYPDTVVPMPPNSVGPFVNFQPYLYWTSTPTANTGHNAFSFNTGWQGSNHDFHYMYVLPMIDHKVERTGITYQHVGPNDLRLSSDGLLVYDPVAVDPDTGAVGITWLADANFATTQKFGLDNCFSHGRPCIDSDGSMKHKTAVEWVDRMKNYVNPDGTIGYLGQTGWKLPPADPSGGCDFPIFGCSGGPLGELYFHQLNGSQGNSPVTTPDTNIGGFRNLQPYLYWACAGPDPCQGPPPPNGDQSWSFSFGNGFQGTDIVRNNLYALFYYPETPAAALDEAIMEELENFPEVRDHLLSEAEQISTAQTAPALGAALSTFTSDVNSQRDQSITSDQADYLIALADATAAARDLQPPPRPCSPHCV